MVVSIQKYNLQAAELNKTRVESLNRLVLLINIIYTGACRTVARQITRIRTHRKHFVKIIKYSSCFDNRV